MQCVERGLIGIDDGVERILPELANPEIISSDSDGFLKLTPARNKITLRHLLTHTSGISYDAMQPLLVQWRKSRGESPLVMSGKVVEAYSLPLMFEPGTSWVYGASLDWAGVLVGRLNGNRTLSSYTSEHIFDALGLTNSTFHLADRPDLRRREIQMMSRTETGLKPIQSPYPENPRDDSGGMGLVTNTSDFALILSDLLREDPVLLKKETVASMFTPQFGIDSLPYAGLVAQEVRGLLIF